MALIRRTCPSGSADSDHEWLFVLHDLKGVVEDRVECSALLCRQVVEPIDRTGRGR